MIKLPIPFLPFDPIHDNDDSDEDDDDSSSESEEDRNETSSKQVSNGTTHNDHKQIRHNGGGVILVSDSWDFRKPIHVIRHFRVQLANVYLLQC